jgi:hypothetical protein
MAEKRVKVLEEKVVAREAALTTTERREKTRRQKDKRSTARKESAKDNQVDLSRTIDALEEDFDHQAIEPDETCTHLDEALDREKAMKVEIQRLKKLLENPTPRVPFGEKAQKWDYRVFSLARELLCVRLTASQCFRVTEIFLRFFFPGLKVRVPSQEMFKKWRSMMYNIVKHVNVKCCEKMDVGHVGADESRKGGVSILGVIMRVVNGTRTQDLMLDCAVIGDQCAETELAAMLSSFRQEIGEWVVEVDIMRVVSGISDNASGAVKVSTLFGAFKKERCESLSVEEKAALTEEEKLLWQTWDTLSVRDAQDGSCLPTFYWWWPRVVERGEGGAGITEPRQGPDGAREG